jgi:hypothetical protein
MDGENSTAEATQPECSSTLEAADDVIKVESVGKLRRSQRILDRQIARAAVAGQDTEKPLPRKRKRSVTRRAVKRVRRDTKRCCSRSRSRSRRRRNMMAHMDAVFEKMRREFCAMLSNAAREDAQEEDGDDSSMEVGEEEDNLASKTVRTSVTSVETTQQVFTCPPSGSSSDSSQDSDFEQENEKGQSNETSGDGTEKQPTEEAEPEARSRSTSSSSDISFEAGSESVEAARKRLEAATERLNAAMERPAADPERLERMEVVDAWDEE